MSHPRCSVDARPQNLLRGRPAASRVVAAILTDSRIRSGCRDDPLLTISTARDGFEPLIVPHLASFALDALRVAALLLCCLGPGLALVGRLPGLTRDERRLLALVAGLGAVGTLASLLALAGGFDRLRVLALLLLEQAAWIPVLRRKGRKRGTPARGGEREFGSGARLSLAVLAGTLPVALLLAAYPPSAFDDTMYHLPLAEGLAEHGRPTFEPELRFPAFPLFEETLMAALFTVGGGEASAHLLSTAQLLLLGGVVSCWARRLTERRLSSRGGGAAGGDGLVSDGARVPGLAVPWSAASATALVLGSPLFLWLGSTAYVDLAFALFAASAFWVLDLALETTGGAAGAWPGLERKAPLAQWLALAGALAGASAAVKYHGLFFLGAALLVGAHLAWRRRRPAALAVMTLVAVLVACPWYLRNAVVTGNPVFPFLSGVFGANPWSLPPGIVDGAHGAQGWSLADPAWLGWGPALRGVARLALDFLRSPWLLAADSVRPVSVPSLSPFAALLPIVAAFGLARRETRWISGLSLVYLALWLANVHDVRYLAPGAALMAVLAAPLAAGVVTRRERTTSEAPTPATAPRLPPWLARTVPALVVLLLLSPGWAFGALRVAKRGLPPVSEEGHGRYLDRWLPGHALLACAGRELGPAITIYGLGTEQLQHYAPGRLLGDVNGPYRYARVMPLLGEPTALAKELQEMGADLFLVKERAMRLEAGPAASSETPLRLLARCGGFELWEVAKTGPGAEPTTRLDCGCGS